MNEKDASAIMGALLAAAMLGNTKKEETEDPEVKGDKIRKQAEDLGNRMYHAYLGFKDAGFTDDQAFQIVLTIKKGI